MSNIYHVTYGERESEAWRRAHPLEGDVQKRLVYRWGSHWGILEGDRWRIESRVGTAGTWEPGLVEECRPVQDTYIVPVELDDLWEEEYVSLSKGGLEYNGLVMLRGDGRTVLEMAEKQGLPLPPVVLAQVQTPVQAIQYNRHVRDQPRDQPRYQHNKPHNAQRRCLIRD